jgi:RND superfamily putative drug exporter
VVFQAPDGDITDAADRAAVEQVFDDLSAGSANVASVVDPYQAWAVSQDGSTVYAQITYTVTSSEMESADQDALEHAAEAGRDAGLTVEVGGEALSETPATGATEVIGVAVAAVVLVITFGSLVAAGLPLVTALIGVGISVAAITALSGSRHRRLRRGLRRPDGGVALVGLAVVNLPVLTKMGLAASGAAALAVVVALTLIPALPGSNGPLTVVVDAWGSEQPRQAPRTSPRSASPRSTRPATRR